MRKKEKKDCDNSRGYIDATRCRGAKGTFPNKVACQVNVKTL